MQLLPDVVKVEEGDGIAVVEIDRPKALNALNELVIETLTRELTRLAERPRDVRAVVLRGAGDKAFVAGADIAAMADMPAAEAMDFAGLGHALGRTMAAMPQPILAAVHGYALGGGCELALACDFIYASDRAVFGQPEVGLGLIPGFGGTQRLPRRIGAAMALELVTTGRLVKAHEALRIGLVNAVFPADQLFDEARKAALAIASKAPKAVAAAKRAIHRGLDLPLRDGCDLEVDAFAAMFETRDAREGMKAFIEKRDPTFEGN